MSAPRAPPKPRDRVPSPSPGSAWRVPSPYSLPTLPCEPRGRARALGGTLAKKFLPLSPAPRGCRRPLRRPAMLAAKRQDGGLFKGPPYPGYPFIMIPDLTSPYLPNGSLSPTARTLHFQSGSTHYSAYKTIEHQIAIQYLQMKWPLLDVQAGSLQSRQALKDARSPSPAHIVSNKVPVVQHPHHVHPLTPLITYSNEHFTPGNPPPHLPADVDPKTGELRNSEGLCQEPGPGLLDGV